MWIVKLALDRPYTFIVMALLILIISPVVILRTPTDIFPNIDIPVISVAWQYAGLNAEEVEGRITSPFERSLSTLVDNIQHLESTTYNGEAVIKIFLQPGADLANSMAQVTAVSQQQLKQMPPGEQPPEIINYSASSVPILQIGLSGKGLNEQQLNDLAGNFIRTQIVTVPGAVVPAPYGGKIRQIMVNLDPRRMQARGLSSSDVLHAVASQNLILPSGTAKIGPDEYYVRLNASPTTVAALNNIPIKQVGPSTIYLRDVATVSDGFTPQTNIARQDGQRGVLVLVLKAGNASTISVVNGVRKLLPRIALTVPPQLKMQPLQDQAIFVEHAVSGVVREGVIAAALTGLMILLFLGSWRSTLIIAVSIPLSILTSILTLSFLHETINIMTLGGLALAVGILVDDATVTIENIERYLEDGYQVYDAILRGCGADCSSGPGLDPVHLHRVPAHVLSERGVALSLRSSGGSCRLRHAGLVCSVPNAGAHPRALPAQGSPCRAYPESFGSLPAGFRTRIPAASRSLPPATHPAGLPAIVLCARVSRCMRLRIYIAPLSGTGLFSHLRQW